MNMNMKLIIIIITTTIICVDKNDSPKLKKSKQWNYIFPQLKKSLFLIIGDPSFIIGFFWFARPLKNTHTSTLRLPSVFSLPKNRVETQRKSTTNLDRFRKGTRCWALWPWTSCKHHDTRQWHGKYSSVWWWWRLGWGRLGFCFF